MIKDRQIKTGSAEVKQVISLIPNKNITIGGIEIKSGESFQVTKSEAKRLMALDKGVFKISMD